MNHYYDALTWLCYRGHRGNVITVNVESAFLVFIAALRFIVSFSRRVIPVLLNRWRLNLFRLIIITLYVIKYQYTRKIKPRKSVALSDVLTEYLLVQTDMGLRRSHYGTRIETEHTARIVRGVVRCNWYLYRRSMSRIT